MIIKYNDPYPNDGLQDRNYKGLMLEVMSQSQAESYIPNDDEVCISIRAHVGSWMNAHRAKLSDKFVDVLELQFDDTPDQNSEYFGVNGEYGMTEGDADKIADFVIKNRDKKKIVIHCFAGISRSRSMAAAIADQLIIPFKYTVHNGNVYNATRRALFKKLEG